MDGYRGTVVRTTDLPSLRFVEAIDLAGSSVGLRYPLQTVPPRSLCQMAPLVALGDVRLARLLPFIRRFRITLVQCSTLVESDSSNTRWKLLS